MEKIIAVGVKYPGTSAAELNYSMEELSLLLYTAGGAVAETVIQKRAKPDPAYFIGEGKAFELSRIAEKHGARAAVFNDDLTPAQQKNLEEASNLKIVDRTRLILDIFANRARTKEGILQVELAQLNYFMPRLTQKGIYLDGQVGGIGTRRGPGERKLEYDRRRIRDRINYLNREIDGIREHRKLQRLERKSSNIPVISLIGYTNAGKSTLLNTLLDNSRKLSVYADDKLFATLDPTVRKITLPSGRCALVSDTVGFIKNLPHQLIAAFRATLEEIKESDCLVHVIDITSHESDLHEKVVVQTIAEIDAAKIPLVRVYNKCDIAGFKTGGLYPGGDPALRISAKTGKGVSELLKLLDRMFAVKKTAKNIEIPYEKSNIINLVHRYGEVIGKTFGKKHLKLKFMIDSVSWEKLKKKMEEQNYDVR